jgi:hypothetical protein
MTRAPILIAAALAALALASCGDDSDDENGQTTREAKPPATATQSVGGAPIGAQAHTCKAQAAGLGDLRATGVDCASARRVMLAWADAGARCRPSRGESRSACSVRGYRCLSVSAAAGGAISVDCSQPGRSISFRRAKIESQ